MVAELRSHYFVRGMAVGLLVDPVAVRAHKRRVRERALSCIAVLQELLLIDVRLRALLVAVSFFQDIGRHDRHLDFSWDLLRVFVFLL